MSYSRRKRTQCFVLCIIFITFLAAGLLCSLAHAAPEEFSETSSEGHASPSDTMTHFVLALALIVIATRIGGFAFERFLKLPSALGEICAGVVIGPYALGRALFTPMHAEVPGIIPISSEIHGLAVVASILLLFVSGLETDLSLFIRYSFKGTIVGIMGFLVSFILGDLITVAYFDHITHWTHRTAIYLGLISSATSVGITARILLEKQKLSSPEGVTILSAAVIDDILGMISFAILFSFIELQHSGQSIPVKHIVWITTKALLFCGISFIVLFLYSKYIFRFFKKIKAFDFIPAFALFLALFLGSLSEHFGLAMIIGAFIAGLALSRLDMAEEIHRHIGPLYRFLVPIFFCVMGMMLDISLIYPILKFGLLYTVVAVIAKVIGCGLPTFFLKFNWRGALRVGLGMLPRGEVALIFAGIGLSAHIISKEIFGVAILMTFLTTLVTPPALSKAFSAKRGTTVKEKPEEGQVTIEFKIPQIETADFFIQRFLDAFGLEEFYAKALDNSHKNFLLRKENISVTLCLNDDCVLCSTQKEHARYIKFIIFEELVAIKEMTQKLATFDNLKSYQPSLF